MRSACTQGWRLKLLHVGVVVLFRLAHPPQIKQCAFAFNLLNSNSQLELRKRMRMHARQIKLNQNKEIKVVRKTDYLKFV